MLGTRKLLSLLAGRSPNLCLITDKLSPETVEQDDQKIKILCEFYDWATVTARYL